MYVSSWIFIFHLFVVDGRRICYTSERTPCQFMVDSESEHQLKNDLKDTDSILVKAKLKFPGNVLVNATKDTILPTYWLMSYKHRKGDNLFTSWPVDYFLYSFGLLDSRTLDDVSLKFNVSPNTCKIQIGDDKTNCGIVKALENLNITIPSRQGQNNETSTIWCYISEYPGIRDTLLYTLKVHFGLPLGMFGYKCCHKKKNAIYCDDKYDVQWNKYQILPYYVGIVFFCYFPILLMKCSARAMDSGSKFKDTSMVYEDLDNDHETWIFLQKRSPLTVSSLFLGIFGLAKNHPVTASRIRRVLYVLGLPTAIYAEICMFRFGWPELVRAVIKADIPFGFSSLAVGIKGSSSLFLPVFGGPFVSLVLFFVIGVIVLVVPRDLGAALEKGISVENSDPWTLLRLNVIQIEELSFKSCINRKGYQKVHAILKANIFMLFNPQFWRFAFRFFRNRWERLVALLDRNLPRYRGLRLFVKCLLLFLYVPVTAFETTLAIIYYGVPIIKFLHTTVNGYTFYLNRQFLDRHKILNVSLKVFSPLCLIFYLFMSCIVCLQSFNFLVSLVFFVYLSVVIFPNYSFCFVYSFLMLIFFIYRIIVDIEKDYLVLLHQSIKAVKHLTNEQLQNSANKQISESTIAIRKEMSMIGEISISITESIREKNNLPGIRRDLYEFVVRRHRPVHIAIFLALMQICIMTFLVLASIIFVSRYVYPLKSDDSKEIYHVMSVLLITILPNLVYSFFSSKVNQNVRKMKVRQTVVNFFQIHTTC